jgi:YjbE family integral membrane protein
MMLHSIAIDRKKGCIVADHLAGGKDAMLFQWISMIGGIALLDIILSGDNAIVIGAAAAGLPRRKRLQVIICGGGCAIALRICLSVLATVLLQIPFLGIIGGIILLVIAARLLLERSREQRKAVDPQAQEELARQKRERGFWAAILTVIVADLTMSLDNIIAIGAIANGNVLFVVFGLLLSLLALVVGSVLISELINRFPLLLDLAALVLAWTAARIILDDDRLQFALQALPWIAVVIPIVAFALVLVFDLYLRQRDRSYRFSS